MHQSATDIASFTTGRASVLIGPRGAFGAQKQHLLLRDASRIRAELDRLLMLDSNRMMIRPYIARWGLDPNVLTRSDRSLLADWLAQKAAAGVIGIIVVPDPVVAFAGLVDKQEMVVSTLKGSQALQISTDPATMLPAGLDDRFLILLSMVPDYMVGTVKRKFNDMIDAIGLEVIAVGLLMWIGAHFVPGLNLVVLAFDLFFLSGEVMRAIEIVAKSIDDVVLARTRSDLVPIAKILAAAIAVLVVNGVLNRFLKAKKITRGQSKSTSSRGRKRTRSESPSTQSNRSLPKKGKGKGGGGPPASASKSGSTPGPKKFPTAEAAAVDAMQKANPNSVKQGREYGGWVKKNSDGTYSYDPPVKGTKDGLSNMPNKGSSDEAWYHTHGAPDPGYDNENFSGATGDKGYSKATKSVGYLATPSGVIKKYDPKTGVVTTLSDKATP